MHTMTPNFLLVDVIPSHILTKFKLKSVGQQGPQLRMQNQVRCAKASLFKDESSLVSQIVLECDDLLMWSPGKISIYTTIFLK